MRNILTVTDGVTRHPLYRMKEPINLQIGYGEQVAIVGRNASGKSILVDTLVGRYPLLLNEVVYDFDSPTSKLVSDNVKYMAFRDSYGDADGSYYYQQRWNMDEQDGFPMVKELLPVRENSQFQEELYELLDIKALLDKPIIQLSSGEMRKFQLTRILLSEPKLLILDNPFIGLDASTRDLLQQLIEQLIHSFGLQVILVLSKIDEIPDFVTHVLPVENRICGVKQKREEFLQQCNPIPASILSEEKRRSILMLPESANQLCNDEIIKLNKVSIRYGERVILRSLDWTVRCGERWALTGKNGSGKSTLLSLVCADNPQSYACDISLFGRKRGSGESIWEIKKHIGYVSPEMHRAYLKNLPAIDIVASGLHDSIGLYKKTREEDKAICRWWMDIFGIKDLADRNFLQLSSGEQRMVLLARAFVKDPELLILDEPLHGLDLYNRRLVKDIIEAFCERKGKTLVMVTHYQEELPKTITNTLVLQRP